MSDTAKRWARLVGGMVLALTAIAITAAVVLLVLPPLPDLKNAPEHGRALLAYLLTAWAIGPPVWFFIEWTLLRPSDPDGAEAKALPRTQELASKIWAGVLVVLGLLYGVKVG